MPKQGENKTRGRETRSEIVERIRKSRAVVGGFRRKMAVPPQVTEMYPDEEFRWVNDSPGNLHNHVEGKWRFVDSNNFHLVEDDLRNIDIRDGSRVRAFAGTNADGSEMHAYLMSIPREIIEEVRLRESEERDDAIQKWSQATINADENRDHNMVVPPGERPTGKSIGHYSP